MSRRALALFALSIVLAAAAFVVGREIGRRETAASGTGGREVLYWVDPMNAAFRSDEPGIAPCGMPLVPVYADGAGPGAPPGMVDVRPDRQQLIGLRVEPVEPRPSTHTLRLLGRVVPADDRVYRLYTVTDGWVRQIASATTGSLVAKDELLASYYSQEILGPQQAYLYALEALDRFVASGTATPDQIALNEKNVRTTRQVLVNLGMSETQADEIARRREVAQTVELRAPAPGFVLARNVSPGQRFDRATELYVIADLRRVWVLADLYDRDAGLARPGMRAVVRLPRGNESLAATVGSTLPQFDAVTRTFKVRLVTDNPGYLLRPDMFVDVELPVELPAALIVPASAVLDSGLSKSVFVERAAGRFERRPVETGWRFGDRVQVTSGLAAGDRVVVAGNFLLDSESRMRLAGAAAAASAGVDPVCGMEVDPEAARAAGRTSEHDGRTYFFCATSCKEAFDADPARFAGHADD